jgi:HemY protein
MRSLFIFALVALLAAVGLVALIETDPGYVLISYGLTTIESSLWVGLLLLLIFNVLVYYFFRFMRGVLASGGSFTRWRQNRRLERGRRLTARGALHYFRGEWSKARKVLMQSVEHSPQPALNFLLAAQSSSAMGESDKAEEFYLELESGEHADSLAAAISRSREALDSGNYDQAVAALEGMEDQAVGNSLLLRLLKDAYLGAQDWSRLVSLLPLLKKAGSLDSEQLDHLAERSYGALLSEAGDADEQSLEKAWAGCPDEQRKKPEILAIYVTQLLIKGGDVAAEKLLQKTLKKSWHPQLVNLYGLTAGADSRKQLQLAEAWLVQRSDDAGLLLCLGRLSLREQLWGKARDYFETSQRLQPSSECCAELARLLFGLGEREKSAQCYREGLLLVESQLPNLPLPKK